MQDKEQSRLDTLVTIIGAYNYDRFFKNNRSHQRLINSWTKGQDTFGQPLANPDENAEQLLRDLLESAIIHKGGPAPIEGDESVQVLIELNATREFIKPNDVELLNTALKTQNLWLIFQVLSLDINVNTPIEIPAVTDNVNIKNINIFECYRVNSLYYIQPYIYIGSDYLLKKNDKDETLFQHAKNDTDKRKSQKLINIYINANIFSPLFTAYYLEKESKNSVQMLLDAGADLNQTDSDGLTLEQLATKDKRQDILDLLAVQKDRKFNLRDIRDKKKKEILDYTRENCIEPFSSINSEGLVESAHNQNAMEFWLAGYNNISAKYFLNGLLDNSTKIKNTQAYALLFYKLQKKQNFKDVGELRDFQASKVNELLKYIGHDVYEYIRLSFVYGPRIINWTCGVNFPNTYSVENILNYILELAVENGDEALFNSLIEANTKNKFIDNTHIDTFKHAIRKAITYNKKYVKPLLDCGFSAKGLENELFMAFTSGNREVIKLLLDNGADAYLVKEQKFIEFARNQAKTRRDGFQVEDLLVEYEKAHPVVLQANVPAKPTPTLQKILSFRVSGNYPLEDEQIIFGLNNSEKLYNAQIVNQWFKGIAHNCYERADSSIEIYFNLNEFQKADLLSIFAKNSLALTDEGDSKFKEFQKKLARRKEQKKEETLKPQPGLQKKVSFNVTGTYPNTDRIFFSIENSDQQYDNATVLKWFKDSAIMVSWEGSNVDIYFGLEKLQSTDVIKILAQNNLALTDEGVKNLREFEESIRKHHQQTNSSDKSSLGIQGQPKEELKPQPQKIVTFSSETAEPGASALSTFFIFSIDNSNKQYDYEILNRWFKGDFNSVTFGDNKVHIYFSPKGSTISNTLNSFAKNNLALTDESYVQLFKKVLFPVPQSEWTAFGFKPELSDEDCNKFVSRLNNLDVKVTAGLLSEELQSAISNLSLYGAKLLKEFNDLSPDDVNKNKRAELEAKLNSIEEFLKTILGQDHLKTPEAMETVRKAFLDLETKDKNRSHNFYKVQSFFRGLTYQDANNETWYIRSTTGELMFHVMNTLEKEYKAAHPQEEAKQENKP